MFKEAELDGTMFKDCRAMFKAEESDGRMFKEAEV